MVHIFECNLKQPAHCNEQRIIQNSNYILITFCTRCPEHKDCAYKGSVWTQEVKDDGK
jgi:hypothetical protein